MFIEKLEITNFKSFSNDKTDLTFGIPNGERGSGLNIFVGENNTGKSTVFEAIEFLRNGSAKSIDLLRNQKSSTHATIELVFKGKVEQIIRDFSQNNKVEVFRRYIFGDPDSYIKFSRCTDKVKTINLWSETNQEYKDESGIDAPVKKLFEFNFVWADTNPNDEVSFGTTTLCGNLLKEIVSTFTGTESYRSFSKKFQETFNCDNSPLKTELREIEERTKEVFRDQFGPVDINFRFEELKASSFFKNTVIEIDDGVKTPITEKGSGMQRAVSLALLQVYAEKLAAHPENDDLKKPFFLFIDEPEICLHPKAQTKLLDALLEISRFKQVFLTTHSPYFIATQDLDNISIFIFKKLDGHPIIENISINKKLLPWSPTWGEINFKAYQLPTVEFHNELYGYLQECSNEWFITKFDAWLEQQGIPKFRQWTAERGGKAGQPENVTLQTFIRNKIHHPENDTMREAAYTQAELEQSILQMIELIEKKASNSA